jgi:ABC-2 type transport system permease protein
VARLAALLWFPYAIAFPVSLLTNTGGWETHVVRGFLGQIAWLCVWYLIYRAVWRTGLKRYGAVGG